MTTLSPSGGVNEREPTLIGDTQLQDTEGAEYRVGQPGLYVARGRKQVGDLGVVTGKGIYEAGFDNGETYAVAHEGNRIKSGLIVSGTLEFKTVTTLDSGSLPIVGAHYANRHYLASNVQNVRLEAGSGTLSAFPIGMSQTEFAVGVSVTQGAGLLTATIGLEYWVTEYDSTRGIESLHGDTANTGAFSALDSVIVTVTGTSTNARADTLRWYRSTDGGGFPDGGLIRETAIGTTQITDTNSTTGSLTVPQYGIISIGGLDTDRDEAPPAMSIIFGPFQDSLLGVDPNEPRVLRFTPAGFPDSWPSGYAIPLETARQDKIVSGVVLPGRIGVFCNDSVHVIYRLPRDSDNIFAAGEAQEVVTPERGCRSRRGATIFTPPGQGSLAAWVARDGIWVSNLTSAPSPLTDHINWRGRVSIANLDSCRLMDDALNRRLIFIHRRAADTTHNTGLWYLDYQQFNTIGIRITFADHGPLADAVSVAYTDGERRVASIDSRAANGQVYIEAIQDVDDSALVDAGGSVNFRMRTKEYLPAGPRGYASMGAATWMHDAGPESITHRFYVNRRDAQPEVKPMPETTKRTASEVQMSRSVNSFSLEIESTGTVSYGVHWLDMEGFDAGRLGGIGGA